MSPNMNIRIIMVLIIAVLAFGAISYLHNERNHKLISYVAAKYELNSDLIKNRQFIEGVYDIKPYTYRVKQRFVVYSTLIAVVALGLSALILRPRKTKRQDIYESSPEEPS